METDPQFYHRADAHIELSNQQISPAVSSGKVSASFMYSVARFNAWLTATGFSSGEEMEKQKDEVIEYLTAEYAKMLEENLEDYISQFEEYMGRKK